MAKKAAIQASILNGAATLGVAPGAVITIRDPGGGIATLWQDRDAGVGQANPFNADALGHFLVYATPGRFKVTAVVGLDSQVFEDVIAFAQEFTEEIMSVSADAAPVQKVTAVGIPSGIIIDWDVVLAQFTPNSLLVKNASDITIKAGAKGYARVDYQLELQVKDGGAAPDAGDVMEVSANIEKGASDQDGSVVQMLYRAEAGSDVFTISGYTYLDQIGLVDDVIKVFLYIVSQTGFVSPELEVISSNSKLSIRRSLNENV